MKKEIIVGAVKPSGPYSHAVLSKDLVFLSGIGPLDPKTNKIIGSDIKKQTEQTLKNIENILKALGLDLNKVVKVNTYITDAKDFASFNEVYRDFFRDPFPARTTIICSLINFKVEIDVVAEK